MSKLLINEPPLMVLPSLAKAIGLNESIVLQQLHYWLLTSSHKHDGRKWIYNTYENWQTQFPFWSLSTIRRALSNLRSKSLILTTDKYNKRGFDNTLWFAIDYEALASVQFEQTMCSERTEDVFNLNSTIPETTTETTTETTKAAERATPAAAQPTDDAGRVWDAWQSNMPGTMTPVMADAVNGLIDDYSAAEIIEAIGIACKRNKRNFGYVEGILRRGAFQETPKPKGGDYRPPFATKADRTEQAFANVERMLQEEGAA